MPGNDDTYLINNKTLSLPGLTRQSLASGAHCSALARDTEWQEVEISCRRNKTIGALSARATVRA
jgi:hypothetical protein